MRSSFIIGSCICHLLISVVILSLFTSRVCCSSTASLYSFQFNHLSTKSENEYGDVSQLPSHPIQEFDLTSYDLNNISDESLTIPQLASIDSIDPIDSGKKKQNKETGFNELPVEIIQHIATMPTMKFEDVVRLGATERRTRYAMRDILPSVAGSFMPSLNELCHFITSSRKPTVHISCRLPNTEGDIDKIRSDKIRLELRALNHLLERKASQPNTNIDVHRDADKGKATCLVLGATDGLLKIVELLLDHHANVHAGDDSALRIASYNGHLEVVKLLLDHHANVHAKNDAALVWASMNGQLQVVKLLLEHNANVHAMNDFALRIASEKGHLEVVKLLLDHHANVHAYNDGALRIASEKGQLQVVKLLLEHNANVHAMNDFALRIASMNGHLKVVMLLFDHHANVHAMNDGALRMASMNGQLQVVKLLLDHHANVHAYNDFALRIASEKGHLEVVKLLKGRT